jgi:hypothetical protein
VKLPPLLSERSRPVQLLLVLVVPAVFGVVTGIFLGISAAVYLLLSLAAVLGGVAAGLEHFGAAAGARRGAVAGAIFGAGILIAHQISGAEERADLPDPPIVLMVLTAAFGALLAALGGSIRARQALKDEAPPRRG